MMDEIEVDVHPLHFDNDGSSTTRHRAFHGLAIELSDLDFPPLQPCLPETTLQVSGGIAKEPLYIVAPEFQAARVLARGECLLYDEL
jgi:hypothetical protein